MNDRVFILKFFNLIIFLIKYFTLEYKLTLIKVIKKNYLMFVQLNYLSFEI